jgi:hypothetical protein
MPSSNVKIKRAINIFDYADSLNLELVIRYYPNQGGRFMADFDNVEYKDKLGDGILSSNYGNGGSPKLAIEDFIKQIQGKYIVLDNIVNKPLRLKIPRLESK